MTFHVRIRHTPWTPEEDAKLLVVILSMPGSTTAEIARAAAEIVGRPSNGCVGRMRQVPHLREAVKPRPKPEPKRRKRVEPKAADEPQERKAVRGVSLPRLPFALPPRTCDETRPYDRRAAVGMQPVARTATTLEDMA